MTKNEISLTKDFLLIKKVRRIFIPRADFIITEYKSLTQISKKGTALSRYEDV